MISDTFCIFPLKMAVKDHTLLVIDDNKEIRESLELFLGRHFQHVLTARTPNNVHTLLRTRTIDLVLLDMNFGTGKYSGNEGIFWLKELLKLDPALVVILITAYGNVKLAVSGIKEGAFDFILKPWDENKLLSTIHAGIKLRRSSREVSALRNKQMVIRDTLDAEYKHVIGDSPAIKELLVKVQKVAQTDANVLVLGENGTGKELIAREIHRQSQRENEIFMALDLSALTETLFESELFGHTKGAFTDAKEERTGKIEAASGGTLFLDEIGNLPVHLQSKILTLLQTRILYKLGSNKPVNVDFRLISATNKPLLQWVKEGLFREDLLYRINTLQLEVPPLRERAEDIMPLAHHFLKMYAQKYNKPNVKITAQVATRLENHSWPGNIRELKHTMEKGVILSDGNTITSESLGLYDALQPQSDIFNLDELEKQTILKVIKRCKGNMSKSAQMLGISRTTLYVKMSKYGV